VDILPIANDLSRQLQMLRFLERTRRDGMRGLANLLVHVISRT